MFRNRVALLLLIAATATGCGDESPPTPPARPVRAVTVERAAVGETVSLTGQIRAQVQANFAFRIDGRLIERRVNVGDVIEPGQLLGRLDPLIQENGVTSAQAAVYAAQGQFVQARDNFERQKKLLETGFTPKARYDDAQMALQTAEAQVRTAEAQLRTAREQLGFTNLVSDSAGVVTSIGAEPGEVVAAGKMIVQVAHEGGRDAVFDVPLQLFTMAPRDVPVRVALSENPQVTATGRVREAAPQADPVTRTYQVKVGLIDPPESMKLGATVTGKITLTAPPGVQIPAAALTQTEGHPAVWVVDPQSQTVSLRDIGVLRYDSDNVVVSQGLAPGDTVITAGVQVLRPGQKVRVLGAAQ